MSDRIWTWSELNNATFVLSSFRSLLNTKDNLLGNPNHTQTLTAKACEDLRKEVQDGIQCFVGFQNLWHEQRGRRIAEDARVAAAYPVTGGSDPLSRLPLMPFTSTPEQHILRRS
jgi:hypothetical protein